MPTSPAPASLIERYRLHLLSLAPRGLLFEVPPDSLLAGLFGAIAAVIARVHARAAELLQELDPEQTREALPEWERMLGLPDPCAPAAQTFAERRARVIQKYAQLPRPTLEYLQQLAAGIGYFGVAMEEDSLQFRLVVSVPSPRFTLFRVGQSRIGDKLGSITRAEDLECLLREQVPAHVTVVFDYSGV